MAHAYHPLNLAKHLQVFRSQRFTGLVCLKFEQQTSDAREIKRYFVSFLLGEINYVGDVIPTVEVIGNLLAEHMDGRPFFKMGFSAARGQCDEAASIRDVLLKVVETRLVTWAEVERAVQRHAESSLRVIAQTPGVLTSKADVGTHLCFGDDQHCLNWSALLQVLKSPGAKPASRTPAAASLQSSRQSNSGAAQVAETPAVRPTTPRNAAHLPTILSVDDSPIVQKVIQRTLSPVCNVLLANDALLGLKILSQRTDIALVLLDVNMPGVSGLDFCRTVRQIPTFKNLPVVMLTANEGFINKAKGQLAGSTLYLTKPVDEQKLLEIIRKYTRPQTANASSFPASLSPAAQF